MSFPADLPKVDSMDTSQGNRFAPYGPENHSAPLWIISLLGVIYSFGVLMIRVFIKRRVFGWDDSLIVVATLTGLAQAIVLFKALKSGLGLIPKNVSDLSNTGSLTFSAQVLLLLSLYLAKCSGVLLLRRLFVRDHKAFSLISDISLVVVVLCGIATLVLSSAGCPSSGFFVQTCSSQNSRWTAITVLDVVTEILLLVLPAYLVWQLQMKTPYKLRVIAAFGFRILVIILTILHLNARIEYTNKGELSPFEIVPTLMWFQALLAWSLISTTIPNLKAFLQSLSANWGGTNWGYTKQAYGNGTFEMKNMNSSMRATASGAGTGAAPEEATEMDKKYDAAVTIRPTGERTSLGSGSSQDMIIRKDTTWTVVRS